MVHSVREWASAAGVALSLRALTLVALRWHLEQSVRAASAAAGRFHVLANCSATDAAVDGANMQRNAAGVVGGAALTAEDGAPPPKRRRRMAASEAPTVRANDSGEDTARADLISFFNFIDAWYVSVWRCHVWLNYFAFLAFCGLFVCGNRLHFGWCSRYTSSVRVLFVLPVVQYLPMYGACWCSRG